jgi:ABC-type Fe3+ transport system substrate-binding protein
MKRLFAVLLAVLGAVSCSKHPSEFTLQVLSPHPQTIEDEFGAAFEAYYRSKTGIDMKVVWRDMGGTSDDLRWIKSEFGKRPEGIDLDVFFGGGNDPYQQLKELGYLDSFKASDAILAGIPKDLSGVPLYDDKDFTWYGAAISGFGIIYNKELISRLGVAVPQSWEDLADAKLFTWVGAGDPRHSGTVHMMYEIILQAYGWDHGWRIITGMAGNTRAFVQNAGDIPRAVAAGQVAAGGAIDFYAWTQIDTAGASRVGFVMPKGLSVVNTDSIAILKGAPHLTTAQMFVEFVLSDDGQKLWYLKAGTPGGPKKNSLFRMPVRVGLYEQYGAGSPVEGNPFKWGKGLEYNSATGTARYEALNDLIGATVVDTHELLVSAWKVGIDAGVPERAVLEMSTTPVTEAQLLEVANTELADPVKRNTLIAQWIDDAKSTYREMARH